MSRPGIHTFTLGDFMTNCFVVTPEEQPTPDGTCWIVDCGFEPGEMLDWVESQQLRPEAILLTHAHADHIAGVDGALARFGDLPVYLHESEQRFCSDPMLNLSGLMGMQVTCQEPDRWLKGGEELALGGHAFRVVHAPGHSPGCVLFIHDASNQALVGDTLFAGSIGRIDFPTSDPEKMRHTLQQVMMGLPDELEIHPGHGPSTTIGDERRSNPFIRGGF
jgi:glyoxylase-like metal-dependent hydrolase (beta-lactamase superfamily II)